MSARTTPASSTMHDSPSPTPRPRVAVGIDVGGTFTDLAALSSDGTLRTSKVLSVPTDRAAGVLHVLTDSAVSAASLAYIAHGTTVVTNLLLERRGARVVACATEGFTDVLELRRQERAALYDLTKHHAPPLVARDDVLGVRERLVPGGVLLPLEESAIDDIVRAILLRAPDMVAITLLHAYEDGTHERLLADAIRTRLALQLPDCDVVCSHEVLPEIREYERMATTVAEAYARPAVRAYLATLGARLAAQGFPAPRVMTSAGGTMHTAHAAMHAASLALSGPAGGVTGAAAVARALQIACALTIDIGGTSADVGLIVDGEPLVERGGDVAGVPIALPRVLVEAVAAGGGSIGWIDAGGALRAGPESAGALPGPAAYGRGGTRPTITDAHVVLEHIASGAWSGGVHISASHARDALALLARPLNVSVERAAEALIATADATMARALRRVSVERGVDPRDATLIAFGGGGPLHACGLADRLGMSRIVIPPHAGVLSAVGLAIAPVRRERVVSLVAPTSALDAERLRTTLHDAAVGLVDASSDEQEATHTRYWVRARFVGQGYELDVPVEPGDCGDDIATRFGERHQVRTGFVLDRPVECISVRAMVGGAPWPWQLARAKRADDGSQPEPPLHHDDGLTMTRTLHGPMVVTLADATLFVAEGWTAAALPTGGWMLTRDSTSV
ncbi:MAG: hydantoinase/oxoprolinase family protein [Gemmatimonadaceae bacterium]|nr:hydantoinase/oxoprolinase family protein [Gemmatimonadaceae bacterium]